MATGTLFPQPWFYALDTNANPMSGAKAAFYVAGTTTPAATYSDVGLTTPNSNPVLADPAGRLGPIYLTPGQSYKLILSTSADVLVRTQDNISAVPPSASNLDVAGTAGEALTAGVVAYLSDGSGSKTAGQWFLADADNTYSSTTPELGMVPSSISSGSSGTIRQGGRIEGLTGLTPGTSYYVSATGGALTSTAPTNSRLVGVADTTTSLVLSPNPPPASSTIDNTTNDFRITLTTGVPVTTTDVLAATTVYVTPYKGNRIALYSNSTWGLYTATEKSIALGADTTSLPYDVFGFVSSGTLAIERLAWMNTTTRATALTTQDGVLVKTGDATRRYLGTYYTTAAGQTEDSYARRMVWNYSRRVGRPMRVLEATASWNYTLLTWRQANAAVTNQLDMVIGVSEDPVEAKLQANVRNTNAGVGVTVAFGLDSTTAPTADSLYGLENIIASNVQQQLVASYTGLPGIGRHTLVWLEESVATGTTTFYGNTNAQSGVTGMVRA